MLYIYTPPCDYGKILTKKIILKKILGIKREFFYSVISKKYGFDDNVSVGWKVHFWWSIYVFIPNFSIDLENHIYLWIVMLFCHFQRLKRNHFWDIGDFVIAFFFTFQNLGNSQCSELKINRTPNTFLTIGRWLCINFLSRLRIFDQILAKHFYIRVFFNTIFENVHYIPISNAR